MKVIGITGGVGSGKSEILKILKEDYQAKIILADNVAHELMEPGGISYDGIIDYFGRDILNTDKTIDRQALGSIVFSDDEKLQKLNEITHRNVDQEILRRMECIQNENPDALIVCETALLVGAEYESRFDQLWYIYTREEVRYERLRSSRGYSNAKIHQMIESQKSEDEFKQAAAYVIDNSGDIEETKKQIRAILR